MIALCKLANTWADSLFKSNCNLFRSMTCQYNPGLQNGKERVSLYLCTSSKYASECTSWSFFLYIYTFHKHRGTLMPATAELKTERRVPQKACVITECSPYMCISCLAEIQDTYE